MAIAPPDVDGDGGGYGGGGGSTGGGGVNWIIDPTPDTLTFNVAPANGAVIVVNEYDVSTVGATSVWALGAWSGEYGYPSEVEFFAERLAFAGTATQPQTLWMSRIGDYSFFGKSTPIQDDDALSATMNARQLNAITDLLPKQHLLALTVGGVWKIGGGDSEVVTPTSVQARRQPSTGADYLAALDVGETAIYLTQKGGQVRDLAFTFESDGYAGSDLTAFASHLLEGRTIVDWAYQEVPYSAVFAVRDDGWLLAMTYKREHQVVAWTRHDTQGEFISTATVAEASEHACYVVVERVINGAPVRYIERFADQVDDDRDWVGMDCSLSYDGRNATATTLTITSGTVDDTVTVTASASAFVASNVGDQVVLHYDGDPLRITITGYTSATVVEGYPSRDLTAADLSPGTDWALAVDTVSGLDHLEGCTVQVAGDGYEYAAQTVAAGTVTLNPPAVVVHVGLAYTCDFESLDMMLVGGQPVGTRQKLIREIGILVKGTRSIFAGTSFDTLEEHKPRSTESMNLPPELQTQWLQLPVHGEWQANPSVCIRNTSPFRCTVLAIEPSVEFGK